MIVFPGFFLFFTSCNLAAVCQSTEPDYNLQPWSAFTKSKQGQQQNIDVSLSHTTNHTKLYFCKDLFDSKVCKKLNEV